MTGGNGVTPGLVHEILDALERHGYYRGDDQHAYRAIGLIGEVARIYEGTRDYPAGAYLHTAPSSWPAHPGPGGQAGHQAVILAGADITTVVAALGTAADCHRGEAELCTSCADKSCPACQARLHDARACDHLAAQVLREAQARAAARRQPEPDGPAAPPRQPEHAAGWEAGQ